MKIKSVDKNTNTVNGGLERVNGYISCVGFGVMVGLTVIATAATPKLTYSRILYKSIVVDDAILSNSIFMISSRILIAYKQWIHVFGWMAV